MTMMQHDPSSHATQPDSMLVGRTRRGLVALGWQAAAGRRHESSKELLAETQFMLAQALWEAPESGRDRPRAIALAEQARDTFEQVGYARRADIADIERWLGELRAPERVDGWAGAESGHR